MERVSEMEYWFVLRREMVESYGRKGGEVCGAYDGCRPVLGARDGRSMQNESLQGPESG